MNDMKKKIAIQGHARRGAEVIKALEELGGKNIQSFVGTNVDDIYFIDENNNIEHRKCYTPHNKIYTLEEYLESLQQTEQKNDKIQRQLSVDIETANVTEVNNLFSLNKEEKVLVVGELFTCPRIQGGGSSDVVTDSVVTPKDAFDN